MITLSIQIDLCFRVATTYLLWHKILSRYELAELLRRLECLLWDEFA